MLNTNFVATSEKDSRWLMIVLHGLGDSSAGYEWLPSVLGVPWLNYLLVNAPDPYYGGYSWYDFTGDSKPGVERSRKVLFELLDSQREAGFPSQQTFMFGFSQGSLMTVDVGLRYGHQLAGLIGVSGYIFEHETLLRQLSPVAGRQRLLITHGLQDPMIPVAVVRKQIELLKEAKINVRWHEFEKAHTIAGKMEISVIREFVEQCRRGA
jgi:phospholipase/carboxylesterase